MRKLASIQRIKNLEAIEGADAIEKATVLGWQVVVKKGEYAVGDLTVYVEIDSLLPEKPDFEFMRKNRFRVRTIRLRGQVSQGICFQTSILPAGFVLEEDADCTEVLGIVKYEPPVPAHLAGIAKGKFPGFIPKTDETRVQVLQEVLDKYKGTKCYVTEKVDGSSVTYFLKKGNFGVCSRNLELVDSEENSLWKCARELDIEIKLRSLGFDSALQGEIVGEGIQKNVLKIRAQKVLFYNFFFIDEYRYASFVEFENMISKLGLEQVPVLETEYVLENDVNVLVKKSTVKSKINPEIWAEGIVIRPLEEIVDGSDEGQSLHNGRVSFKAINPEFLLKYEE